jgi:signal recognition particle GTPase
VPILMVGLQGSGKTTTSGKIALRLRTRERKKVLLASLDVHRPAAQLQLQTLAQQAEVTSLPIVAGPDAAADRRARDGCGAARALRRRHPRHRRPPRRSTRR